MTTILKTTTERFREMFELLTMSKGGEALFNPISLHIIDDDEKKPYLRMEATNGTNTVITAQKLRNIDIHQDDDSDPRIVADAMEIIESLKLFDSDKEIEIEFGPDNVIIRDTETVEISDTVTLPAINREYVSDDEIPFEINDKGIPIVKDKAMKFIISANIRTDFIRAQIRRADFVNVSPRLFMMNFNKNELNLIVGNDSDAYSKLVKSTVAIGGKGSGACIYGDGYEQVFKSLSEDVLFMANADQPCWITSKTDNYICQFMLAPAFIDSADLPE